MLLVFPIHVLDISHAKASHIVLSCIQYLKMQCACAGMSEVTTPTLTASLTGRGLAPKAHEARAEAGRLHGKAAAARQQQPALQQVGQSPEPKARAAAGSAGIPSHPLVISSGSSAESCAYAGSGEGGFESDMGPLGRSMDVDPALAQVRTPCRFESACNHSETCHNSTLVEVQARTLQKGYA